MKTIFSETDKFYKVNLHSHTTESDGSLTPARMKEFYKSRGYSAIAITDHEFMVDHSELCDDDFLVLPAYEYGINAEPQGGFNNKLVSCHINIFSKKADNHKMICYNPAFIWHERSRALIDKFEYVGGCDYKKVCTNECFNEIIKTAAENDMFVMLNHPSWSLLTSEFVEGFEGLWGIEVCNYGCAKAGLEAYEGYFYDLLLKQGKRVFCTATDDCHTSLPPENLRSDCCGGFVMVKGERLSHDDIINALLKGDFYASTGVEIKSFQIDGGTLRVKCSPCRSIKLRTVGRRAEARFANSGEQLCEAEFSIRPEDEFVRVEFENDEGKRAYTNAVFTSEIF